jgi:UDP-galactopyranose mutase
LYDFLIVGAGLYGAVFAQQMTHHGKRCLVVDRRNHIAGNIWTWETEGITVHNYGPHIFHTDKEIVWAYVNRFAAFNNFIYSPIANYKGELYNLPFNMNTFTKMWPEIKTPEQAADKIRKQVEESGIGSPANLEEQALSLVGKDIYEKLIRGYTEKQWGRPCTELPAFIIQRLPVRMTFDNNYFKHPHQGIPKAGYTAMVENLLSGIEVRLGTDYLEQRCALSHLAKTVVYTGPIDEYYGYCFGHLEYRSLRFETEVLKTGNYQGVACMNYTDSDTPYTRCIEHKHFTFGSGNPEKTVITREYPLAWRPGEERYYPINDERNMAIYRQYAEKAKLEKNVVFGGRLGTYRYLNMDNVIENALNDSAKILNVGKEQQSILRD